MSFIFTFSSNAVSVFLNGVPETIDNTHPKWQEIFDIVTGKVPGDETQLRQLIDTRHNIKQAISDANIGDTVTVGHDCIMYLGKPVHSYLTRRMMAMLKQGIDITPWKNFMAKLFNNPSKTAVDELFLWLEKGNMPITENGNFLAYKKVRDDYASYHRNADGSDCHNKIGTIVQMPRNEVDDNRERTCSQGLHFCSWHYLPHYMGNQGKVLVVEIDPSDVVSIPSDYDNAKGRAWRYLVRGEIDEQSAKHAFPELTVANSEYDGAWGYDDDEDVFDGWDEDYNLAFDQQGFVKDIADFLDQSDYWTRGQVTPLSSGGFVAVLTDDEGNRLSAEYDDTMTLIRAKRI